MSPSTRGQSLIEAYQRLISRVDRPSVLIRLVTAFVASWMVFFWQVSVLDGVGPDFIDKGVYCLHAFGCSMSMEVFRSVFPYLVAAQVLGVVLVALRIVPIAWGVLVVVPLFWHRLVDLCPWDVSRTLGS